MKKFKILIEYECVAKTKTRMRELLKECPLGSIYITNGEYIKQSKKKAIVKERGIIIQF